MKGYSLLEVMVAFFVLAAVIMASFSIFENGGRQTVKLESAMVAVRLAQQICEELHAKSVSEITVQNNVPFEAPFSRYHYSIQTPGYTDVSPLGVTNLLHVSVGVIGPLDSSDRQAPQTASVSLSMLLGRQPYP